MRPLRFTIFVATTTALLVVAVYLWTPLVVVNLPNKKLARPAVASNSVATVEAGAGLFRPPPLRPVRTEHPHLKRPPVLDGSPALKVVRLVRPPVALAPRTVQLPVAASGVSPPISPGARLEHPASPAPTPALPTPPSSTQPRQPVPPPVPRTTSPTVAKPSPQPRPPATPPPVTPPPPDTTARGGRPNAAPGDPAAGDAPCP